MTNIKEFFRKDKNEIGKPKKPNIIKRIFRKFRRRKNLEDQVKSQAAQAGVAVSVVDPAKIQKEPKVYIPPRVLQKLFQGTELWPHTETGEALVGIVIPPNSPEVLEPTVYVLGTIVPDDSAIRQGAYFKTGDDLQAEVFIWLSKNWDETRKSGLVAPEFNHPLKHLGDWHKHPEMLQIPSGGDLGTAMDFLTEDNGMDQILVPVTTYKVMEKEKIRWNGEKLLLRNDPDNRISISFSYLSRKMLERGEKNFLRVKPEIIADNLVPELPPVSWHLKNQKRFKQEMSLMKNYGCQVKVLVKEMTSVAPMEIIFAVQKQGWRNRLLIVTNFDYPDTDPEIKIFNTAGVEEKTEKKPQDVFSWLNVTWEKTQEIFGWRPPPEKPPDKFMVERIWELEKEKKL